MPKSDRFPRKAAFCFFLLASAALVSRLSGAGGATDVPVGEVPAIYRERLAGLLTPLDEVLKRAAPPAKPDDSGSVLLNERIIWVQADGRRVIVRNFAYKTLTEAGVKSNSDEVTSFRKKEQKAYLALAETILADGTRIPVQPDAVLVESPQREAADSLYDDQSEMRVIFPGVKPGSVVHAVTIVEDLVAKMPGEFTQTLIWGGTWASGELRYRIELPQEMAARLKATTLGEGNPSAVAEDLGNGRVARSWTLRQVSGRFNEVDSQPAGQIGPVVNLSTVNSWDDIARWYAGLTAGRDQPGATLRREVDSWLTAAKDRNEILGILHSRIADQVRYVGLEFGASDYQPHNCNDVWSNQYGDCKDKANLLSALLRQRGFKAYLALVNTEHAGWIDRRSPTYREFDHAIVAVNEGGGHWLFCDPTMKYSSPGMLGPGSSDRDVLVVMGKTAEWVHTPPASAAAVHYDFDLTLSPDGELAGWLKVTSEGFYASWEKERFVGAETADLRSEMSDRIQGFFPGAEIVDVDAAPKASQGPYVIRGYFVVPGTTKEGEHRTLSFPRCHGLLVDTGDQTERQSNLFLTRGALIVSARVTLPKGLRPAGLPAPFQFDSPAAEISAAWRQDPASCTASFRFEARKSLLRPSEFPSFSRAEKSIETWFAQPIALATDGKTLTAAAPILDLPMMATGDGQIDLVDRKYPENGDPALREAALRRAIQYFPNDRAVVFRATVRLAMLDWNADRNQAAHERLSALLRDFAGRVAPENYAWGKYCDALVLRDLKRTDDAAKMLEELVRDGTVSDYRRAEAAARDCDLLIVSDPQRALDLVQIAAGLPEGLNDEVISRLMHVLLRQKQGTEVRHSIANLVAAHPDSSDDKLERLLGDAQNWDLPGDETTTAALAAAVTAVQPNPSDALRKQIESCRLAAATRRIHAQFMVQVTHPPLARWYGPKEGDNSRAVADFEKESKAASNDGNAEEALRVSLRALASGAADADLPERLWQAANNAEWAERKSKLDEDVCAALLQLEDELPSDQTYYMEGRLIRAMRQSRRHDLAGEQIVLLQLLNLPTITGGFVAVAAKRLGLSLEKSGDPVGAIDAYRRAETVAPRFGAGADCVLRAALLCLNQGKDSEGTRLLKTLANASDELYGRSEAQKQLRELVLLAQNPKAAEFWTASRGWWDQWLAAVPDAHRAAASGAADDPVIADPDALENEIKEATRDGKADEFFAALGKGASAARWQPSQAIALSLAGLAASDIWGDRLAAFQDVLLKILQVPFPPGVDGARARLTGVAAISLDIHQPEKVLDAAARLAAMNGPADRWVHVMHRLRASAALTLGRELSEATQDLEKDLAADGPMIGRMASVTWLANLYERQSRPADEEGLLRREIARSGGVEGNDRSVLEKRLSNLVSGGEFTTKITSWLKARSFPWFDQVEPRSIDDPRLRDLETLLNDPLHAFTPFETVKLQLLAARDGKIDLNLRRTAFQRAVHLLMLLEPDAARRTALAASVLDESSFDEETRLQAIWNLLRSLALEGRSDQYRTWRARPECDRFNASFKADLALLDALASTDHESAPAMAALAAKIPMREMTSEDLQLAHAIFELLLGTGDLAQAGKFVSAAGQWTLAPEVGNAAAEQMQYTRQIRVRRELVPVHAALVACVQAHFPAAPAALPETYRDARQLTWLPTRTDAETFAAGRYLIERGQFEQGDLYFWRKFFLSARIPENTGEFFSEVCRRSLAASSDDATRAAVVQMLATGFDTDEPDVRHRLEAAMAAYRDPAKQPDTYAAIRHYEAQRDYRLGTLTTPESVLADLPNAEMRNWASVTALNVYLQRGDRDSLRRVVASLDARVLANPDFVFVTVPAFHALGMSAEENVARETAKRRVAQMIGESWMVPDPQLIERVATTALALEDGSMIPDAWIADLKSDGWNPIACAEACAIKAYLGKDWAALATISDRLVHLGPAIYSNYWYVGIAAAKQNRRDDAIRALTTYVQYAHDELNHPRAVELLRNLRMPVQSAH
ncbi:MAG TPA: DUF3857 domain-containing transglutaminase family protein [Candidatus Didemnitutus sp.]